MTARAILREGQPTTLRGSVLELSEIDYPPEWPDRHTLRVTASGCMLTDAAPGDFQVWVDEDRLLEVIDAWLHGAPYDFMGVWLRADLAEAVGDFIATCPATEHRLDWARHFELLAARLREGDSHETAS